MPLPPPPPVVLPNRIQIWQSRCHCTYYQQRSGVHHPVNPARHNNPAQLFAAGMVVGDTFVVRQTTSTLTALCNTHRIAQTMQQCVVFLSSPTLALSYSCHDTVCFACGFIPRYIVLHTTAKTHMPTHTELPSVPTAWSCLLQCTHQTPGLGTHPQLHPSCSSSVSFVGRTCEGTFHLPSPPLQEALRSLVSWLHRRSQLIA